MDTDRVGIRRSLLGHLWTVGGLVVGTLRPPSPPGAVPWSTTLRDGERTIGLSGLLAERGDETTLLVLVHGLGGNPDSLYIRSTAAAADRRGLATLRIALRGADGSGADVYHAGLADDVEAALASPALARFERILVCGFSLGGHVVLTAATRASLDPRVRAVAAVCPPLDLEAAVRAIHRPDRRGYEEYVLRALRTQYDEVASRAAREGRSVPSDGAQVRGVRSVRQWDELVVCPRFGFPNAHTYYQRMSIGPRLRELGRPALVVVADPDPMIALHTVIPALAAARGTPGLEIFRTRRGGHVAFAPDVEVVPGVRGAEAGVVAWLARHASA